MIAISGSFTAVAVISYLMSGDMEGRRRGLVHRIARRVPLQTIKIIVVSWQILTQVETASCRCFKSPVVLALPGT